MLVVIVFLSIIGLILGSFINALVWRTHEQSIEINSKKFDKAKLNKLSIIKGRSICPKCKHRLYTKDLVPLFSWAALGGKCRYCKKNISIQYPLIELITALSFVLTYIWWPIKFDNKEKIIFGLWLMLLTGLIALFIYDMKWKILPNKIIYPLFIIAIIFSIIRIYYSSVPIVSLSNDLTASIIGGGIFYIIFQVSKGKWIGGGDVKLGFLLGLIVGTPWLSLLFIFLASFGGSIISLPLIATGRLKKSSVIPFGPLLITGSVIVVLFGTDILNWYTNTFIRLH